MYISFFDSTIFLNISLAGYSFSGIVGCSSFGPTNLDILGVPFDRVRRGEGGGQKERFKTSVGFF